MYFLFSIFFLALMVVPLKGERVDSTINNIPQGFYKLVKKKAEISDILGKDFADALAYYDAIENVALDWTLALPIAPPPPCILEKGANAFLKDPLHHYAIPEGSKELNEQIKSTFRERKIKIECGSVVIRPSLFHIINDVYSTLDLTRCGGVMIPIPTFGVHPYQAFAHGIKTHFISTSAETSWKVTPQMLEATIKSSGAKVFLITNPANPTGAIYTQEDLEGLAKVLKKHRVLVISDEIFHDIVLTDLKPVSIASVEGMEHLTITLGGVGKAMGLVGLRLSYGHVPTWLSSRLPDPLCGLSSPVIRAGVEAIKRTPQNISYLKENNRIYAKRLQQLEKIITKLDEKLRNNFTKSSNQPMVKIYVKPNSANVVLVSFKGLRGKKAGTLQILSGVDLAQFLVREAGVAMSPGEVFFINKEEIVLRIPLSAEKLSEGFEKIQKALLTLQ